MERSAEWLRGAAHAAAECKQFKAAVWYQMLLAEAEAREASEATTEDALTACFKDHPLYREASVPTAAEVNGDDKVRQAIEKAHWIGCSPHEWPTIDDIPLLCHALIAEHNRATTAAEVIEACKQALDYTESGAWDSHYGKGLSVGYARAVSAARKNATVLIAAWEAARK